MQKQGVACGEKPPPVVQLHHMVLQGLELLVVLVIADADDGDAGALDGGDQLAHTPPVATTHAIHLIHDQADLQTYSSKPEEVDMSHEYLDKHVTSAPYTYLGGKCLPSSNLIQKHKGFIFPWMVSTTP